MDVAIMQPYFFPYIGYFQLMHAVDRFVFFDDAQYMKGGWLNRNRILGDGAPRWWTYPVVREDYRLPIQRRRFARSPEQDGAILAKLDAAYRKAPHLQAGRGLVAGSLENEDSVVSTMNQRQLEAVGKQLGIKCEYLVSSGIDHDRSLTGQQRVIDICGRVGATRYINSMGGAALYGREAFEAAGIELAFLQPRCRPYPQLGAPHVGSLSIIDVLMFNPVESARAMLDDHDIVLPPA